MPIYSEFVEQLAASLRASPSSSCCMEVELYHPSKEKKRQLQQIQVIDHIFQELLDESNELRLQQQQYERERRNKNKGQQQHHQQEEEEEAAAAASQSQLRHFSRLHRSDIVRLFGQAAKRMHLHVDSTIIEDAVDVLLQEVLQDANTAATATDKHGGLPFSCSSSSSMCLNKKQFRTLFMNHPDLMKCIENELLRPSSPSQSWMDGSGGSGMTTEDTLGTSERGTLIDDNNNNNHGHYFESQQQTWYECALSNAAMVSNWFYRTSSSVTSPSGRAPKSSRNSSSSSTRTRWKNQKTALLWNFIYLGANLACFIYKAYLYVHFRPEATNVFGNCIVVARGSAQCLNLNCALILFPICRHLLTRMRVANKYMRYIFPFDSLMEYHIFIGMAILFFIILHVGAHVCDFHRFSLAPEQDLVDLFGDKLGTTDDIPDGQWDRWVMLLQMPVGITGIIMLVCMIIAYPLTRIRRRHFNTFWWSHQLLLIELVALCFHGMGSLVEPYQAVYWIMLPLTCYIVPRLLRETPRYNCSVLSVAVFQKGNVVRLRLAKPDCWKNTNILRAGMYAFVKIPQISRLEWHPFTMTSAPSDSYIEFHLRRAGDWTAKVQDLLQEYANAAMQSTRSVVTQTDLENGQGDDNNDESRMTTTPSSLSYSDLVVKVEGPIGASSQGFSHYPIVVLIGAGIGVAPMISVLKELLANPGKMKRVFLYWTVRDCASFDWFSTLMQDIYHNHHAAAQNNSNDDDDHQQVMHIRHFLTSAQRPGDQDIGAVLLHYAKQAKHNKTNFDLLLGQYSHHQADVGRPNWEKELLSVKTQAKELGHGKCGVFLCGPDKMAKMVAKQCFRLSKKDPDFHFYFSKEIF